MLWQNVNYLFIIIVIIIQGAVSRLPDKGAKIHKQIAALAVQLEKVRIAKGTKDNAIEL